jgi:glutamyl-tRNA synthetase
MLSVVADDKLMEVTDVIRGDDHLTNTFKQLILFSLLDWAPPRYSHIPLIHSQEGTKLSKRHGDLSVKQYKENSFLPAALINYLLRLGWGHGDKEFFSIDEAVSLFSLEGVGKSPAKFDEKKLNHINTFYFKKLNPNDLLNIINSNYKTENYNKNLIEKLLLIFQERSENINDFLSGIEYMLSVKEINLSEQAVAIIKNTNKKILDLIITDLKNIENWNSINIEFIIRDIAKKENLKLFNIASPIRAAVTGKNHSPSIFKILELLGKENTLKRLKKAF